MRISTEELALLTAACADKNNLKAQELVNVLGTHSAEAIAQQIALLPAEIQKDLEKQLRDAIDEQRRRIRPR